MSSLYDLDKDIYVDLQEVKAQAALLGESVRAEWPDHLSLRVNKPTAMLARQIASPNYEMLWFARLARRHGFRVLILEHTADRFTSRNPMKHALARMPIVKGRGQNGHPIIRPQKVFDIGAYEGRPLRDIITYQGESLVSYHHRKLKVVMGHEVPDVIDISQLLPTTALEPSSYYRALFKLLSGYLVLFEDFVADQDTAEFFQSTVFPAWQDSVSDTGRLPNIVRMVQGPRSGSAIWSAYPASAADHPDWMGFARSSRAPVQDQHG